MKEKNVTVGGSDPKATRALVLAGATGLVGRAILAGLLADAKSRVFYNRVKGETEEVLARLQFEGLVIARLSLLVGNREAHSQPARPAERVATAVSRLFGPLVPASYRPVAAADVARGLLARVPTARGLVMLPSGELHG